MARGPEGAGRMPTEQRAGRPRYIRRPRYVGGISASTFMARAPGWGGECRTRANGVQSFPPQGPRGSVHRWQGGRGPYELGKPRGGN
jgi:hypothetical protein